jgi:hypothetical protein
MKQRSRNQSFDSDRSYSADLENEGLEKISIYIKLVCQRIADK